MTATVNTSINRYLLSSPAAIGAKAQGDWISPLGGHPVERGVSLKADTRSASIGVRQLSVAP
jgi:hypothetical protein